MSVTAPEAKAHDLLSQLEPGKLAEVCNCRSPTAPRHRKSLQPDAGWVSMDEVLAEYGLTTADFPLSK